LQKNAGCVLFYQNKESKNYFCLCLLSQRQILAERFFIIKKQMHLAPNQKTARDEGATLPANFLKQQALSEEGRETCGNFQNESVIF